MIFEVGKFYKTRGGDKAKVVHTYRTGKFVAIHECGDQECNYTHHSDGKMSSYAGCESGPDLVSEWREPLKVEGICLWDKVSNDFVAPGNFRGDKYLMNNSDFNKFIGKKTKIIVEEIL